MPKLAIFNPWVKLSVMGKFHCKIWHKYLHIQSQSITFLWLKVPFPLTGMRSAPRKLMASLCSSTITSGSVETAPLMDGSTMDESRKRGAVSPTSWLLSWPLWHTNKQLKQTFSWKEGKGCVAFVTYMMLRRWAVHVFRFWKENGRNGMGDIKS